MSAERPLSTGPIIDAHHHLWDLSGGHHPWLTRPEAAIGALGDIGFLRRDYLLKDYAADIAGQGVVHEPAWRRGLAELARHGWALDLLISPHQAEEVAALARDVPGQQLVVNHCGTPGDRDAEGLARWRAGLRAMGRQPNVAIKLSNYAACATARTWEAGRDTLRAYIDAFSPGRCMFGSDYPVARRRAGYAELCTRFREVAAEYAPAEQHALLCGTAARLHGIAA